MNESQKPVLSTQGVTKTFGGIRAVDRCTLGIQPHQITGLIGPNGAGKTTLFNLMVGLYAPDQGSISFRGRRIDRLPPYEIVHMGIVKTFQIPREFRALTVLENLMVAHARHPGEGPVASLLGRSRTWDYEERVRRRALEILSLVELDGLSDAFASELSGGQKKLLELARALMADPQVILLDEPVAGVNPTLTQKLLNIIDELREGGKTFFMIEHDMDVVMKRCDVVIAMHLGRPIAEGVPDEVRRNEMVMEAYLGG